MFSFLYLLPFVFVFVNEPAFTFIKKVEHKADFYTSDHQQNIYSVKANKLTKFNSKGEKLYSYFNTYLGDITHIDASDPLRVHLFYKEFNQILYLDNFLVEIGSPILLDELGHIQVSTTCSSVKGGFWIFDELEKRVFYYDKNLQQIHKSISLDGFLNGTLPSCMVEKNGLLFINIPEKGMIICDEFGGYVRSVPLNGINSFQVRNNLITYFSEGNFFLSDQMLNKTSVFTTPEVENINDVRLENDKLFIFSPNYFNIYKID